MKKIIIPIMILLLTGCLGKTAKGYITKTCIKKELINGNTIEKKIEITSKQGNIEKIIINEQYDENIDLNSIINSKKSEQNLYKQTTGINLQILNNRFIYEIDVKNASELIKERFNIKEEQHKQIDYYEENGYACK